MKDWNEHKKNIMAELATLEGLHWTADPTVADSIFPYVLIEAINLLKNSEIIAKPTDYATTSEDAATLMAEVKSQ